MVEVLYQGRKRKVHTGSRGGKYVVVQGTKRYLKVRKSASKKKPAKKATKKCVGCKNMKFVCIPKKKKVVKRKPQKKKKPAKRKVMKGGNMSLGSLLPDLDTVAGDENIFELVTGPLVDSIRCKKCNKECNLYNDTGTECRLTGRGGPLRSPGYFNQYNSNAELLSNVKANKISESVVHYLSKIALGIEHNTDCKIKKAIINLTSRSRGLQNARNILASTAGQSNALVKLSAHIAQMEQELDPKGNKKQKYARNLLIKGLSNAPRKGRL